MHQSRVISHARGHLRVSHCARQTSEKSETARSLIQTKPNIPPPIKHHNFTPGSILDLIIKTNLFFSRWFETSWFHHICCPNILEQSIHFLLAAATSESHDYYLHSTGTGDSCQWCDWHWCWQHRPCNCFRICTWNLCQYEKERGNTLLRTIDNIDFIRGFNKLYLKVYIIINNEHHQRETWAFGVSISRLIDIFLKVTVQRDLSLLSLIWYLSKYMSQYKKAGFAIQ